jgi:hypothetical protein
MPLAIIQDVVGAISCIDRAHGYAKLAASEIGPTALQEKIEVPLRIGFRDVFSDRAAVDNIFAIMLAVTEQLPFDAVELDVDAER